LFNELVVVLTKTDDIYDGLAHFTENGTPIFYVPFGTARHLEAIGQRIAELTIMNRSDKVNEELESKRKEAKFLENNIKNSNQNQESAENEDEMEKDVDDTQMLG
jgi:hypothetical protein